MPWLSAFGECKRLCFGGNWSRKSRRREIRRKLREPKFLGNVQTDNLDSPEASVTVERNTKTG